MSRSSGVDELHHRADRRAHAALVLLDDEEPFRVQRLVCLVEGPEPVDVVVDQLAEARRRLDGLLADRVVAAEDAVELLAELRLVVETVECVQVFEVEAEDLVDQGGLGLVALSDGFVTDLHGVDAGQLSLGLATGVAVLGALAGLGGHLLGLGAQAHI